MADFEGQQLPVDSFIGGPTDKPLDGSPNEYAKMENLVFNENSKPVTRPGSDIFNDTVYQIPAGNQRIGSIFSDDTNLYVQSARNIYIAGNSSWQTLANPNPALTEGDTTHFTSHAFWSNHTFVCSDAYAKPIKIFNDATLGNVVRTAGLPAMVAPGLAGTAGANSYIYAFTYAWTYTIGDLTFEDEGATVLVQISSITAPDSSPITASTIPVLINGSTDNHDTTNVKVRIYRTINNGTLLYKVAEISNGTTSYVDSTSDVTLQASTTLYTTGGVPDNDVPPRAKFVHIVNGTAYYANVKEGTEINPYKIMQSQTDDPDSVPATFFAEVDEEITGISSFRSNPIIFTRNKIYRIKGTFDELGFGGMITEEFSETIGAVNHNSIVQTREGVFFCGNDGFYWTDGYQVRRVSQKIIQTYAAITADADQRAKIYGTHDKENNSVLWAVHDTTAATENNTVFVLDIRWGLRENSAITTWTGGTSFAPTALTFHNRKLHRAGSRGYLFFHDTNLFTDRKVDTAVSPSLWQKQTILWDYTSTSIHFGTPMVRKWANQVLLMVKSESNVSIFPQSKNDDASAYKDMKELKDESHIVWGDPSVIWGETTNTLTGAPLWDYVTLVQQKRRFPRGGMRCNYKQIRFTNAYTNIWDSDRFESAVVTPTTATMTNFDWTMDVVDYYISFDTDDYTEQYLITSISGGVLTFEVGTQQATPTAGTKKWLIKGHAKGHLLHLLGYIVYFTPLSKSFTPYQAGSLGGNA